MKINYFLLTKVALLKNLLLFCTFKNYQHLNYFYFFFVKALMIFYLKHKINFLTFFGL